MARRSSAPLWLMGLTNAPFGMYGGFIAFSVPQLLSMNHAAESTIAGMTAASMSPAFWTFLLSPMLDVRFSRRWYSAMSAAGGAAMLMIALLNLNHLAVLEAALVLGYFFINLYQSALGGWLSTIATAEEENRLSVWVTIGNVGGGGIMVLSTSALIRHLSPTAAAVLLGALVLLPTLVFPWMPAPGPDRRLASESFPQFFGEVLSLLKRREVLVAILLFVAPAGTFSLTNFLGGVGHDFHASEDFIGLVGGVGTTLGGIAGCILFSFINRLLPLRPLYLCISAIGAIFTLTMILMPHTPAMFAVAAVGENVFQFMAITNSIAIAFETIGRNNPLAATTYCLVVSAFNVPVTYMLFVDGAGYAHGGIAGSYAADAGCSVAASVLLGLMLLWLARRKSGTAALA